MKAKVIDDRCISCGQCEATCPEVFQINDDGVASVIVDKIEENLVDDTKRAAGGCPTDAIVVED